MSYSMPTRLSNYASLVGGVFIHIVIGSIFITGNVCLYLSSYLQNQNIKVTTKDLSILISFQVLGLTMGMALGPYLAFKYSPRIAIFISSLIAISSVFLTSIIYNFYLVILVYGFFYGFGSGIAYTIPMIVSWNHFPEYKGRVTGIILTGFGMGSAIFNIILTELVNPDNLQANLYIDGEVYFQKEVSSRLMESLRILALIYLGMTIISILLIDNSRVSHAQNDNNPSQFKDEPLKFTSLISTLNFWKISMMVFCSISAGFYIVGNYKTFGKDFIEDDKFLALVGSSGALIDGVFRIFWGSFLDYTSFKKTYGFMLTLEIFMLLSIYHLAQIKELYLISVGIIWSTKGAQYVLFATLCGNMYGKKSGPKVFSLVSYFFAGGTFLGVFIQYLFLESLGYNYLFIIFAGLTFVSFLILMAFNETKIEEIKNLDVPLLDCSNIKN